MFIPITTERPSRSFVQLIGFNTVQSWQLFEKQNQDEAKLMISHFNIAIKSAISKSQEIMAWRKIDPKKYNDYDIKRKPSPTQQNQIVKHQKLTNFEWLPTPITLSPTTVSTNELPSPVLPTPKISSTLQNNMSTQTDYTFYTNEVHLKEKKELLATITILTTQKKELEKAIGQYRAEQWKSLNTITKLSQRLQDLNQRVFVMIASINELVGPPMK